MTLTIWSERCTDVVASGESCSFDIRVNHDDGRPAVGVSLQASVEPATAGVEATVTTTDQSGCAKLSLHADRGSCIVKFRVAIDDAFWSGKLYVTDVHVALLNNLHLEPDDESLLRMLYWDKAQVRVLRQFGGGLSGSRVLQVQAVGQNSVDVTQVVKIGQKDSMHQEEKNYTLFENRLPSAAPIRGYEEFGTGGAIVYGDASASRKLEPVVPLAVYFAKQSSEDLVAALYAILETGLRNVYRFHEIRPHTYRSLLSKFLPENLVVSLDGSQAPNGVYRKGQIPPHTSPAKTLSCRQIERMEFDLVPNDVVRLENVPISKMQDDDLNIEDPDQTYYKVKVRFDGQSPKGVSTGDRTDVVARFVTDRRQRMKFAVEHCLEGVGGKFADGRWALEGEYYSDPLALMQTVLDTPCDVAWGTIHGDLHWENVMLEKPENWWLIDYGLTGKGPILFDFVKLEVYLRYTELSRITDLTVQQVLAFEESLVTNPLGDLALPADEHSELRKAADAIRSIRRLAQRYMVDGQFDYWRLLFGYAMALTKYYPTQDKWDDKTAQQDRLKKSARATFRSLAVALSVGRILAWDQARSKRPTPKFQFVGMGMVLDPQPNVIALDVGSKCEPGVVDHHYASDPTSRELECATSLILKKPELVTHHLGGAAPSDVTWTVHEHPDFDCVASTYLAWYRVALGYFPAGARELAKYARDVDAGAGFLDEVPEPERTPYALFQLHLKEVEALHLGAPLADVRRMEYGFAVLDYLCGLEATGLHPFAHNVVPREHGFWRAIGRDHELFESQDFDPHKKFDAHILREGKPTIAQGLVLGAPVSLLFKTWARRAGFPLLVVRWPQQKKPDHRIVVSVPPTMREALSGLGLALEQAESKKRGEKKRRPSPPRWSDVDNSDPWYDGRSPIHAYTIVDSPREGTVLTVEEVLAIVCNRKWLKHKSGVM